MRSSRSPRVSRRASPIAGAGGGCAESGSDASAGAYALGSSLLQAPPARRAVGGAATLRVGEEGETLEIKAVNHFRHLRPWTDGDHADRQLCI
jgi:hypothetical protein